VEAEGSPFNSEFGKVKESQSQKQNKNQRAWEMAQVL
jgi:hypothetical protein